MRTITLSPFRLYMYAAAILVAVLLAAVSVPTATAAPQRAADTNPGWGQLFTDLWHGALATVGLHVAAHDGNLGPGMDPDRLAATTDDGNLGPDMDPDGLAAATDDGNLGPDMGPNG